MEPPPSVRDVRRQVLDAITREVAPDADESASVLAAVALASTALTGPVAADRVVAQLMELVVRALELATDEDEEVHETWQRLHDDVVLADIVADELTDGDGFDDEP
jgi:hypothetical protein